MIPAFALSLCFTRTEVLEGIMLISVTTYLADVFGFFSVINNYFFSLIQEEMAREKLLDLKKRSLKI